MSILWRGFRSGNRLSPTFLVFLHGIKSLVHAYGNTKTYVDYRYIVPQSTPYSKIDPDQHGIFARKTPSNRGSRPENNREALAKARASQGRGRICSSRRWSRKLEIPTFIGVSMKEWHYLSIWIVRSFGSSYSAFLFCSLPSSHARSKVLPASSMKIGMVCVARTSGGYPVNPSDGTLCADSSRRNSNLSRLSSSSA